MENLIAFDLHIYTTQLHTHTYISFNFCWISPLKHTMKGLFAWLNWLLSADWILGLQVGPIFMISAEKKREREREREIRRERC